jgi:3-hydroxyisobutyrate dehydrogenase-like beta-hydroxyacid dehydrogenase
MTTIAFLGQGRMGVPMAGRLIAAGYRTTVWNRTKEKCAAAAELGAEVAGTPADAVRGADIVVTMLRDGDSVRDVLFADGAADALEPGALLLEMSTIGPDAVHDLRAMLRADIALVDAPVVGSIPQATGGTLRILTGGAEADITRAADVFTALGTVEHMGDLGAGAGAKLIANLVLVSTYSLVGECLSLGDRVGMTTGQTLDLLGKSAVGGFVERVRGKIGAENVPAGFTLGLAEKDVGLAVAAGAEGVASAAHGNFADAVTAGLSEHDISAVVADMRSRAQLRNRETEDR